MKLREGNAPIVEQHQDVGMTLRPPHSQAPNITMALLTAGTVTVIALVIAIMAIRTILGVYGEVLTQRETAREHCVWAYVDDGGAPFERCQ
jgi:hypothetical protein